MLRAQKLLLHPYRGMTRLCSMTAINCIKNAADSRNRSEFKHLWPEKGEPMFWIDANIFISFLSVQQDFPPLTVVHFIVSTTPQAYCHRSHDRLLSCASCRLTNDQCYSGWSRGGLFLQWLLVTRTSAPPVLLRLPISCRFLNR